MTQVLHFHPHFPRRKQTQEAATVCLGSPHWPLVVFLTGLPLRAFLFCPQIPPSSPHTRSSVPTSGFSSEASLPKITWGILALATLSTDVHLSFAHPGPLVHFSVQWSSSAFCGSDVWELTKAYAAVTLRTAHQSKWGKSGLGFKGGGPALRSIH